MRELPPELPDLGGRGLRPRPHPLPAAGRPPRASAARSATGGEDRPDVDPAARAATPTCTGGSSRRRAATTATRSRPSRWRTSTTTRPTSRSPASTRRTPASSATARAEAATYVDLPHADCDDCHEDEHEGRFQPTDCQICHITDGFEIQAFDHDKTDFPHTGTPRRARLQQVPPRLPVERHPARELRRLPLHEEPSPARHHAPSSATTATRRTRSTRSVFDHASEHRLRSGARARRDGLHGLPHATSTTSPDWTRRAPPATSTTGRGATTRASAGPATRPSTGSRAASAGATTTMTGFALEGSHSLLPCESCHPVGRPRGEADARAARRATGRRPAPEPAWHGLCRLPRRDELVPDHVPPHHDRLAAARRAPARRLRRLPRDRVRRDPDRVLPVPREPTPPLPAVPAHQGPAALRPATVPPLLHLGRARRTRTDAHPSRGSPAPRSRTT